MQGMDCAGLIAHVFESVSVPYDDEQGYPRTPYDGVMQKNLAAQPSLERIPSLEIGCVVLFRVAKAPQHLAIYDGERIIHASIDVGKVVDQRIDDAWRSKVVACYRIITL